MSICVNLWLNFTDFGPGVFGITAAEFAPELAETFHTPVTDEITAAFQEARYAGRDPDPRTLADLERRWREAT